MAAGKPRAGEGANAAMGVVFLVVVAVAVGIWTPVVATGAPGWDGTLNPLTVAIGVATGQITWTWACTLIAAAEAAAAAGLVVLIVAAARRRRRPDRRSDNRAKHLASGRELGPYTRAGVAESAKRLRPGAERSGPADDGAYVGTTTRGRVDLYQSWEDCALDVWGTRAGKTTSRTIPLVVAAPGPVIATSRKPDLYDATRGPRADGGGEVWLFDPMGMTDERQTFFWNPLRGVETITDARRLASAFCYTGAETKRDEFFGPKGDDLVACLILAAALDARTLEDVYSWATMPRDETPLQILRDRGKHLPARTVAGIMALADKTRSGVYGAAEKSLLCLTDEAATAWVTPGAGMREFRPEAFVTSTDTLYLLAEKGAGAPTPLIAAFTDTIYRFGEAEARRHRGRRLPDPLLSVLDEAANICILEHLPSYYSYFGSLGMPLAVFLQSASQGEEAWGKLGLKAMWSHANIRTLGGGLADFDFLEEQSRLVGEYEETVQTTSTSPSNNPLGSRSTSTTTRPKRIYDVADLSSLPKGRAIVFASGSRPTMIRTRPWWECDFADQVQASLDRYGPG